jgi:hypothetical protein
LDAALQPALPYSGTIKKMNEIIKLFHYSPLKLGILESIQKQEGLKTLKFVIAVSTRWNSLVMSGKRFLEIQTSTLNAMKHKEGDQL